MTNKHHTSSKNKCKLWSLWRTCSGLHKEMTNSLLLDLDSYIIHLLSLSSQEMAIPLIISATTGVSPISPPVSPDTTRDSIYVAAMPLRAKGPAQMLMSLTYSFNVWDLQHYMVIIKPSITSPQPQAFVFDFQPQDPEDIYVALAALSGSKVPGTVLVRKLTKLPKKKCWLVGFSSVGGISKANTFNELWDTDLRIGRHDCRNYTNGLVEYLTGEKHVLERLRGSV